MSPHRCTERTQHQFALRWTRRSRPSGRRLQDYAGSHKPSNNAVKYALMAAKCVMTRSRGTSRTDGGGQTGSGCRRRCWNTSRAVLAREHGRPRVLSGRPPCPCPQEARTEAGSGRQHEGKDQLNSDSNRLAARGPSHDRNSRTRDKDNSMDQQDPVVDDERDRRCSAVLSGAATSCKGREGHERQVRRPRSPISSLPIHIRTWTA